LGLMRSRFVLNRVPPYTISKSGLYMVHGVVRIAISSSMLQACFAVNHECDCSDGDAGPALQSHSRFTSQSHTSNAISSDCRNAFKVSICTRIQSCLYKRDVVGKDAISRTWIGVKRILGFTSLLVFFFKPISQDPISRYKAVTCIRIGSGCHNVRQKLSDGAGSILAEEELRQKGHQDLCIRW